MASYTMFYPEGYHFKFGSVEILIPFGGGWVTIQTAADGVAQPVTPYANNRTVTNYGRCYMNGGIVESRPSAGQMYPLTR